MGKQRQKASAGRSRRFLQSVVTLVLAISCSWASAATVEKVRKVDPEDLVTIKDSDGWLFLEGQGRVVFPPGANTLFLINGPGNSPETVVLIDPGSQQTFFSAGEIDIDDVINVAAALHGGASDLFLFNGTTRELILVPSTGPSIRYDASLLGISKANGVAVDPSNGRLFILDALLPRIVVLEPGSDRDYDVELASEEGRITEVALPDSLPGIRGLAYEASTNRFYVTSPSSRGLIELSEAGEIVAAHDISDMEIGNLKGLTFAPSLDRTDNPTTTHLFMATDKGVVELSIAAGDRR